MGMFDDIRCKFPLPDTTEDEINSMDDGINFQTKSLDCFLDYILITEEGKLYIRDKPSDYTGKIVFYTSGKNSTWFEYEAIFIYGKIDSIKRIKQTKE
jgi:hypothetical protein